MSLGATTWTVGKLLEWAAPYFKEKGIASARLDAEVLLAHALGISRLQLYTGYDRPAQPNELAAFKALVQRRAKHEPVAYLVGRKGFHTLDLKVDRRALIPRPETELVVDVVVAEKPRRILDVGTGSGAIVLAILAGLPDASAVATDVSADALSLARENAGSAAVEFREGSYFEPVKGEKFDVVVSNPPYIAEGTALMPDVVEFEPHRALFSGKDGTDALHTLIAGAKDFAPWFVFELGHDQGQKMCDFATNAGYSDVKLHNDINGIGRVLEGRWSK